MKRKILKLSKRIGEALILIFMIGMGEEAFPNVPDSYGLSPKAMAMGGAFCAIADNFSAVYYNPAGLSFQKKPPYPFEEKGAKLELVPFYVHPKLWIENSDGTKEYEDIADIWGGSIGITFEPSDLYGLLNKKSLALGFVLSEQSPEWGWKPRASATDRYFIMYESRDRTHNILMAMSYTILPELSIGIGTSLIFDLWSDTVVVTSGSIEGGYATKMPSKAWFKAAPIAGLLFKPKQGLSFGLSYRGQIKMEGTGGSSIRTGNKDIRILDFHFIRFFSPQQIPFGIAYMPIEKLNISFDLTWMDWSRFIENEGIREGLRVPDTKFHDTFVPRIGGEYWLKENLSLMSGYYYINSPVPDQTGISNLVDNDKHVFSLGMSYIIPDPPGFWDKPIICNFYAQYHLLEDRTFHKKDPGDPYYPGYKSGGNIINIGIGISIPW